MRRPFRDRTTPAARPAPPPAAAGGQDLEPLSPPDQRSPAGSARPVRWSASLRSRSLATAALLALLAAIVTGHVALVLLAAPALGALAVMPRRRLPGQLAVAVVMSGSRCFEGEDVTVTATVRALWPGPASDGRWRRS